MGWGYELMREIIFRAGYHEWVAFVDNKQLFGGVLPCEDNEGYKDLTDLRYDILRHFEYYDDLAKGIFFGCEEAQDYEGFDWELWRTLDEDELDCLFTQWIGAWGYLYL